MKESEVLSVAEDFSILDEQEDTDELTGSWGEAYEELMGDEDEVDVFFVLPRPELARQDVIESEDPDDLLVLRVMGLPENDLAWVH